MRRMAGYTVFWIAVGMAAELFIDSILVSVFAILLLLLIGYNLFMG